MSNKDAWTSLLREEVLHEEDMMTKEFLERQGMMIERLVNSGLHVPPVVVIKPGVLTYLDAGNRLPRRMLTEISSKTAQIFEEKTKKRFGGEDNPLILAIYPGAGPLAPSEIGPPLTVGLNDETIGAVAKLVYTPCFLYDSYRYLIQKLGELQLGISHQYFEDVLNRHKGGQRTKSDNEIAEASQQVTRRFKEIVKEETGQKFPDDPLEQLALGIQATLASGTNGLLANQRGLNKTFHCLEAPASVWTSVFGEEATLKLIKEGPPAMREATLGFLHDEYGPEIWRYLTRTKRVPEFDAEDIYQDIWLEALEEIAYFEYWGYRRGIRTWLLRRARNKVFTYYKRRGRKPPSLDALRYTLWGYMPCSPLEESIIWAEEEARIKRALEQLPHVIDQLPPQQRRVMQLRMKDYAPRKIGEELKLELGNVYVLLCRARQRLKKLITGTGKGADFP